jgi:hypothetical protein
MSTDPNELNRTIKHVLRHHTAVRDPNIKSTELLTWRCGCGAWFPTQLAHIDNHLTTLVANAVRVWDAVAEMRTGTLGAPYIRLRYARETLYVVTHLPPDKVRVEIQDRDGNLTDVTGYQMKEFDRQLRIGALRWVKPNEWKEILK